MTADIDVILFDVGGTLRGTKPQQEAIARQELSKISQLIHCTLPDDELLRLLKLRAHTYSIWARETFLELNEEDLWTDWLLPDWPKPLIQQLARQLNSHWRKVIADRELFPDVVDVISTLFRNGYRMGIVSNTTTSDEVPKFLRELKLTGMMECVVLSCQYGKRKPNPEILMEATGMMNVPPERCVYIGDRADRDVVAARAAGFNQVIILSDHQNSGDQVLEIDLPKPDLEISSLSELITLFPTKRIQPQPQASYALALSSMWAFDNFPNIADFIMAARRFGCSGVELNHQVNSEMLTGVNLVDGSIISIHEPCPADVSAPDLKKLDWLISSLDEDNRRKGVESIKRSILLASDIGVDNIVVHCGQIVMDLSLENKLRELFETEGIESAAYQSQKQTYCESRAQLAHAHLSAVKKSLIELLEVSVPHKIRLALENRYHYFDIPLPFEMEELLALASREELAFIYDVGHAQTLDRMGLVPHEEWLQRFSDRMVEIHLHDVKGIVDHYAPGLGEVDFDMIQAYLPAEAIRTLEVHPRNTPQEIKQSLMFLHQKKII